jgi:hypothetical protein
MRKGSRGGEVRLDTDAWTQAMTSESGQEMRVRYGGSGVDSRFQYRYRVEAADPRR